jgi:hypothetical protein
MQPEGKVTGILGRGTRWNQWPLHAPPFSLPEKDLTDSHYIEIWAIAEPTWTRWPLRGIEPRSYTPQSVTVLTELSRLFSNFGLEVKN